MTAIFPDVFCNLISAVDLRGLFSVKNSDPCKWSVVWERT